MAQDSSQTLTWNVDGAANTAGEQSGSTLADAYTTPVRVGRYRSYGFSFVWASGTPVGDMELQFSWDGTNWADSGAAVVALSGVSGNNFFNVVFPGGEYYARLFYDRTSGGAAASLSGKFFGRDV
jgi:hypothetical protein